MTGSGQTASLWLAAEVISFRDPAGNRVETFHGAQMPQALRPGTETADMPCWAEWFIGHRPDRNAAAQQSLAVVELWYLFFGSTGGIGQ
jgi:hypothetical protein